MEDNKFNIGDIVKIGIAKERYKIIHTYKDKDNHSDTHDYFVIVDINDNSKVSTLHAFEIKKESDLTDAELTLPQIVGKTIKEIAIYDEKGHFELFFTDKTAFELSFEDTAYGLYPEFKFNKPKGNK